MVKVADAHPRLFHYTTWEGLKGIVESNTLFATHAGFLNDSSELLAARELLVQLLAPEIRVIIEPHINKKIPPQFIAADGGLEQHTLRLVRFIIKSFYDRVGDDFFITSFCGYPDDEYVRQNGLLSQWRAYGNIQGFAIELDTKAIEALIEREQEEYSHAFIGFADAVYGQNHTLFGDGFLPKFNELRDFVAANVRNDLGENVKVDPTAGFVPFCYCISMLKHRGFQEEREVRIAISPRGESENETGTEKSAAQSRRQKRICSRLKSSAPVPYIQLFDVGSQPLPITRIIVGPSKSKRESAYAIEKILGRKIPITICETPFV